MQNLNNFKRILQFYIWQFSTIASFKNKSTLLFHLHTFSVFWLLNFVLCNVVLYRNLQANRVHCYAAFSLPHCFIIITTVINETSIVYFQSNTHWLSTGTWSAYSDSSPELGSLRTANESRFRHGSYISVLRPVMDDQGGRGAERGCQKSSSKTSN